MKNKGSEFIEILKQEKDYQLFSGDSAERLKKIESNSIDQIVTDPPYGIEIKLD